MYIPWVISKRLNIKNSLVAIHLRKYEFIQKRIKEEGMTYGPLF